MIELSKISETDPVQKTVAKCTQGYNKIIRGTSTRTKLRNLYKMVHKRTKEEYATDSANKTWAKRKHGSSSPKKT